MDCWRVNGTLAVSRAIGKEARAGAKATQGSGLWTQLLGTAVSRAEKVPAVSGLVLAIRPCRERGRHRRLRNFRLAQISVAQAACVLTSLLKGFLKRSRRKPLVSWEF